MIYYGMVLAAVVMFGLQFYANGKFQEQCGNGVYITAVFSLFTALVGAAALFVIGGFHFAVTPFTFLMATLAALNNLAFSYFAIRSLGLINLSLFSVFSMVGGMVLPFVVGILFYDEGLTVAKIICLVLITVAMCFTVQKGENKGGWIYYIGVFVTNGLSGVYSMIFNGAPYAKASAADYSLLGALLRIGIAGLVVLVLCKKKKSKPITVNTTVTVSLVACGLLGVLANYLLLLSLKYIPGSLQYPLITGGVMIASTVIGYCTKSKPKPRDLAAVGIAFCGMLALLLPI